jgi:transcriptional regulator with XRE-family HTH domain
MLTVYNNLCYRWAMSHDLRAARTRCGWNQQQAAERLGVTQAYLSMLESGRRRPARLARKLMRVYGLPPSVLPLGDPLWDAGPDELARALAALGYPGFAHLSSSTRPLNPATFLLSALAHRNLDARTAEGLPWVVLRFPEMPFDWLVRESRVRNLQNRLGLVVTLAKEAAAASNLEPLERALADSKLEKEDSFCRELNDAERRWLRENRSKQAQQWNLLSDMRPDTLRYVP